MGANVSFHIPQETLVDELIDPEIVKDLPGHNQFFQDNADIRKAEMDCASVSNMRVSWGMTRGKYMVHIGRMPLGVWSQLIRRDPYLLQDKEKFYAILAKYPAYKIGGFQVLGGDTRQGRYIKGTETSKIARDGVALVTLAA